MQLGCMLGPPGARPGPACHSGPLSLKETRRVTPPTDAAFRRAWPPAARPFHDPKPAPGSFGLGILGPHLALPAGMIIGDSDSGAAGR